MNTVQEEIAATRRHLSNLKVIATTRRAELSQLTTADLIELVCRCTGRSAAAYKRTSRATLIESVLAVECNAVHMVTYIGTLANERRATCEQANA